MKIKEYKTIKINQMLKFNINYFRLLFLAQKNISGTMEISE